MSLYRQSGTVLTQRIPQGLSPTLPETGVAEVTMTLRCRGLNHSLRLTLSLIRDEIPARTVRLLLMRCTCSSKASRCDTTVGEVGGWGWHRQACGLNFTSCVLCWLYLAWRSALDQLCLKAVHFFCRGEWDFEACSIFRYPYGFGRLESSSLFPF